MRAGHPLARGELTPARFATEPDHVIVSRRGRTQDPTDELLAAMNLERKVAMTAPTAATALLFVRDSDLVATVPEPVARTAADHGLVVLPLPFATPPIPLYLSWHQRHDNDRAHAWLRNKAQRALQRISS
ncbi:LysR substrate-binding domain-containing protein [Catenulispora subtropica]|uniref:LysR substrate-binding domain-containing protein n=1 Tax=Catenulispora subtropica TaxID=450798 RepID=A0ABP5BQM6_9ACTN